jgi:hypothetical protein
MCTIRRFPVVAVLVLLPSLMMPAVASGAADDGATKKGLFLDLASVTPSEVETWINHVCKDHRDPGKDDYIDDLVIRDVYHAGQVRATVLAKILPHVPGGGGTQCFDNVFVGPAEYSEDGRAPWKKRSDFPSELQSWCADSLYCGGILTPSWRADDIRANRIAVAAFLKYINSNFPQVRAKVNWYATYEAYFDWIGNNGYSSSIRDAYEDYLLRTVRGFYQALREAGETEAASNRAILWSPTYESDYPRDQPPFLSTLRDNLRSMFANVKKGASREGIDQGVGWLHMQDKLGQKGCFTYACYENVMQWYQFLGTVNSGEFSFESLRVNMEQFKQPLSGGDLCEHKARENWYEWKGVPVGASWEIRYWMGSHTEL